MVSGDEQRGAGRRAIVIGGSIAGLLAARVLADHFTSVTVIERDATDGPPLPRKGAPQGRHVHAFLSRGLGIVEGLFPGFKAAIAADGATRIPMGEFHTYLFGAYRAQFEADLDAYCQTRPLVEAHVRRRVAAIANVTLRGGCDATGFVTASRGRRVRGVRVRDRSQGRDEELAADLVVDASGRGSRTPQWLEAAGRRRPHESSVRIDLGYATRIVSPPSTPRDWRALIVFGSPPGSKRHGVVFPIEGGRWLVTLGGVLGDHPPTDDAGFEAFAASLPVPHVHEAMRSATPLTEIVAHRFSSSLRRHYETLRGFPEGLVVMGDALCSLNPMYGQGMTMAAIEATILDECLRERRGDPAGVGAAFQRRAAKVVDTAWMVTTSEDFRFPETRGPRPAWLPILHRYMTRVNELAARDEEVAIRAYRTMHMIDPPTAVFHPAILLRVLRDALPLGPAARAGGA